MSLNQLALILLEVSNYQINEKLVLELYIRLPLLNVKDKNSKTEIEFPCMNNNNI